MKVKELRRLLGNCDPEADVSFLNHGEDDSYLVGLGEPVILNQYAIDNSYWAKYANTKAGDLVFCHYVGEVELEPSPPDPPGEPYNGKGLRETLSKKLTLDSTILLQGQAAFGEYDSEQKHQFWTNKDGVVVEPKKFGSL